MEEIHITMERVPILHGNINACIGYFDGIHQGHQQLIAAVVKKSKENGAVPALITFDPDPWAVIKGVPVLTHLTTMEERKAIAYELGIRLWIVLDFTKEMADLSVDDFHKKVLNPLHLDTLVCGYDFHYAKRGEGSVETLLAQTQFAVEVIAEVSSDAEKISSSRIERLLEKGDMEKVEALLTRPYSIQGIVVHGRQNGRKMGFPTANLQMQDAYVCPREGVYAGMVEVAGTCYGGIINIGNNPTFGDFQENTIEAHILNFNQEIYGEHVRFYFLHYLRGDVRFANMEELAAQLRKDKENAQIIFQTRKETLPCV